MRSTIPPKLGLAVSRWLRDLCKDKAWVPSILEILAQWFRDVPFKKQSGATVLYKQVRRGTGPGEHQGQPLPLVHPLDLPGVRLKINHVSD